MMLAWEVVHAGRQVQVGYGQDRPAIVSFGEVCDGEQERRIWSQNYRPIRPRYTRLSRPVTAAPGWFWGSRVGGVGCAVLI